MEKEYRYKGYVFRREYEYENNTIVAKWWKIFSEIGGKGKCFYDEKSVMLIDLRQYEETLYDCKMWVNEQLESYGLNHKKQTRRKPEPHTGGCMPGKHCYFCGYGQLFHSDKIKIDTNK